MRPVCKLVVSVLSLVLLATPIMGCVIPAAAMTAAERDCCKRMAQECGKKGMPQSHPCCQTTTVPDHLPALKSSSDAGSQYPAPVFVHALPLIPSVATIAESWQSGRIIDIHSPPASPPVSVSILRI